MDDREKRACPQCGRVAFVCACPNKALQVVRTALQNIQVPLELEAQNHAAVVLNALHVVASCADYCSNMAPVEPVCPICGGCGHDCAMGCQSCNGTGEAGS